MPRAMLPSHRVPRAAVQPAHWSANVLACDAARGTTDARPATAGNALLLQKKITIHHDLAYMDFSQLIHLVGDYLVNFNPPHPNPEMQANQQQQIADSLAVLPKLGRGLDVNLRFQKVSDFEYTDELSVLDMLGINLVHGWLCDPQDTRTASVIKDMSYNQLICMGAAEEDEAQKQAKKEEQAKKGEQAKADKAERLRKAMVVEEFLQDTASQLTYFGLEKLHNGEAGCACDALQRCVMLCSGV